MIAISVGFVKASLIMSLIHFLFKQIQIEPIQVRQSILEERRCFPIKVDSKWVTVRVSWPSTQPAHLTIEDGDDPHETCITAEMTGHQIPIKYHQDENNSDNVKLERQLDYAVMIEPLIFGAVPLTTLPLVAWLLLVVRFIIPPVVLLLTQHLSSFAVSNDCASIKDLFRISVKHVD